MPARDAPGRQGAARQGAARRDAGGEEIAQGNRAEVQSPGFGQECLERGGKGASLQFRVDGEHGPGAPGRLPEHPGEEGRNLLAAQGLVEGGKGGRDLGRGQDAAADHRPEGLRSPAVRGVGEPHSVLAEQALLVGEPGGSGGGGRGLGEDLPVGPGAPFLVPGDLRRREAGEAVLPAAVVPAVDARLVALPRGPPQEVREGRRHGPGRQERAREHGPEAVDPRRPGPDHLRQEARPREQVQHGQTRAVRPHGEVEGPLDPCRAEDPQEPRDTVPHPLVGVHVDAEAEEAGHGGPTGRPEARPSTRPGRRPWWPPGPRPGGSSAPTRGVASPSRCRACGG